MHKFLLSTLLISTFSFATDAVPKMHCTLSQEGPVTVNWKAYKTPLKIGVGGTFDKVIYRPATKEGKNFKEILVGAKATIEEISVNSKNKGRDAKLVKFFFDNMKDDEIIAEIVDIEALSKERGKPKTGTLLTKITMNGITKNVPLRYVYDEGTLHAEGTIDLFDFQASTALSALNKACFAKHQGKTWNDVSIAFSTHIKAVCETAK
ncbi:MAG: YceI family protein [Sulfurospirillum sp.]|nr:MAG: YceI family protein [Sulfurospirillum sp.]